MFQIRFHLHCDNYTCNCEIAHAWELWFHIRVDPIHFVAGCCKARSTKSCWTSETTYSESRRLSPQRPEWGEEVCLVWAVVYFDVIALLVVSSYKSSFCYHNITWTCPKCCQLFIGILRLQSNGPLYINTVIGTLTVDGWTVTFGTVRRGLGGLLAVPNVTAHPSRASVPTSCHLMWHYNCLCTQGLNHNQPVSQWDRGYGNVCRSVFTTFLWLD